MSNILITSAGRRVSLVNFFKTELQKLIPNAKVFTTDLKPALSSACQVSDKSFKVPKVTDQNYIQKLLEICLQNEVKLIIPTIDTELLILAENKNIFNQNGIVCLVSDLEFIKDCRNKKLIHKFFDKKGIKRAQEFDKESKLNFPIFIKPYDGSRSVDTYLINQQEDLKPYHFKNHKLMFLQYINHDLYDEYTVDMYYNKQSDLKCIVPRKRIEVRSGEVNKGLTSKTVLNNILNKKLNRIDGAIGCVTLQVFVNKSNFEDYFGIEINPRFGGGYPLSYLAGANYPKWIIEEYLLDQEVKDFYEDWQDKLLMLRYDSEILVPNYEQ